MAKAKPKKKRNLFVRFLIWIGILIGILLLVLVLIATLFEGKIGEIVINQLSKSLKTELKVEHARLSLIRSFPNAVVTLQNVELAGSIGQAPLAKLEDFSLKCSIMGVITGDYDFHSISVSNGEVNVLRDKKTATNYDIWIDESDDATTTDTDELQLAIRRADLENLTLRYKDEIQAQDVDIWIKDAYLSGEFSEERYTMDTYAELYSNKVTIGEDTYLDHKDLAYDARITIDNLADKYTFDDVQLTLESNDFKLDGFIASIENGFDMDLTLSNDRARLNSILSTLPESYLHYLEGFDSRADLYFNTMVKGNYTDTSTPMIDMEFGLKQGRVSHDKMDATIQDVNFDIKFSTGDPKQPETALLEIKNFTGSINKKPLDLQLTIKGMKNPHIDFSFSGELPLSSTYGWFGDHISDGNGSVKVEKLQLKGYYNDMLQKHTIPNVQLEGLVTFLDAEMVMREVAVGVPTGSIGIRGNDFFVKDLATTVGNSDATFNGQFRNVLPVLFADSLNSKNAQLEFQSSFTSNMMDVNAILAAFQDPTLAADTTQQTQDSLNEMRITNWSHIIQFMKGSFVANIKAFKYDKIEATDFTAGLQFENSILKVKQMRVAAMQGGFEINSKIHFTERPFIEAYIGCNNVDVEQFFAKLNNFGQETLKDHHIRGTLTSLIKMNAYWDEQGNFLDDKLFVVADVTLTDGELIGLSMLESFSTYIKIRDLRHIKFAELKNRFKIENRVFLMPAMFIQSNALNLLIGGTHDFDQNIDYKMKINVSQVIAQRFKKHNPELRPIKAKKQGLFNIYGRLYGNLDVEDGYDFKKGKKNVKPFLEGDMNKQIALTNTLKQEFRKSMEITGYDARLAQQLDNMIQELREPDEWQDFSDDDTEDADPLNEWGD